MHSKLTTEKFISSINSYDIAYQKFSNKKSVIKFCVEGIDDVNFYKHYLSKELSIPSELIQCYACNGRDYVLREYNNNPNKYDIFIIDLDYVPLNTLKYKDIICTTGYSMENFLFYEYNEKYNFYFIFREYYPIKESRRYAIDKFQRHLFNYKNKYVKYYAYYKTCMEIYGGKNFIKIKGINIEDENYEDLIEQEISSLDKIKKETFIKKYDENINLIINSGYLLIRGHDLFNLLLEFLKKDNKDVKLSDLFKLSRKMQVPHDFKSKVLSYIK